MTNEPATILRRVVNSGGEDANPAAEPGRASPTASGAIVDQSPAVAFAWRADTVWSIAYVSENVTQWGYTPARLTDAADGFAALIDARDRETVKAAVADAVARGAVHLHHEYRVSKSDGGSAWVLALVHILRDDEGRAEGFDGLLLDIAGRKAQEECLRLRERALDAIDAGITIADARRPDTPLIYASRGFTALTGYAREDVLGRNCRFLQEDDRSQVQRAELRDAIAKGNSTKVAVRNYRRDGSMFWNELTLSPIFDEAGRVSHFVGVQMDVTERVRDRHQLRQAAYTDHLTGFNNREGFEAELGELVSNSGATDYLIAVAQIRDIEGINSTSGTRVGDRILVEVAQRCQAVAPRAVIGRFGGDRIAVGEPAGEGVDAASLAGRVLDALKAPIVLQGVTFRLAFAVGCATPNLATRVDTALARADMAREAAEQAGSDNIRPFSHDMAVKAERRVRLTDALRHAVEADEFELHLQPKISLENGRLAGAEALLRWNHPTFGMQSPATFIPLAEASGLIVAIGEWALQHLCDLITRLDAAGTPPPPLSVNVSAVQVSGGDIGQTFPEIMARNGLDPARIVLELTESAFADGPETASVLEQLAASGFVIALDDFGTGYSALSSLQRYPLGEIKIDRSFVGDARTNTYSRNIVLMIQRIAATLGCRTVAEGVETQEDLQTIKEIGCDEAQGFYFARPIPAAQFVDHLASGDPLWDVS